MKPRHIALGVSLLVAGAFAIFGDKTPAGTAVVEAAPRKLSTSPAPARPPAPAPAAAASPAAVNDAPAIVALIPRERLMEEGAAGNASAVFEVRSWTPPPPPPPKPPPPPPPVAPPLPFTFLGKARESGGGAWEVFLARGADTLIVRPQMVVDGVYRIDAIAPPMMTMTYLPLKQVQQINIGVPD